MEKIYSNGNIFSGEWKENKRIKIKGKFNYFDGSEYEGGFKNKKRDGSKIIFLTKNWKTDKI